MKKLFIVVMLLVLNACDVPEEVIEEQTCEAGFLMIGGECEAVISSYQEPSYIDYASPDSVSPLLIPEWMNDAVMYEVNVRQYTEEGTFAAFQEELPRLQELGVEILWFMPIHPISMERRIGTLGSYYAVEDYKDTNAEFGSLAEFDALVQEAKSMGFKIILDMVFNHTGWDHPWVLDHSDYYTQDENGIIHPPGTNWMDVAELNMGNSNLHQELREILRFWIEEHDVDGFRFDYVLGVPDQVWKYLRSEVDSIEDDIFFLAEDSSKSDYFDVFNSNYGGWQLLPLLENVYHGEKGVANLKAYIIRMNQTYDYHTFPLNFLTNHDINSWESTIEERFGIASDLMTMFTFTFPGMPLLYSGQESSIEKQLQFFEKDEIIWNNYDKQDFLERLIDVKKDNPALYNTNTTNSTAFLYSTNTNLFSFVRYDEQGNHVVVIANITNETITGDVHLADYYGEFYNRFDEEHLTYNTVESFTLPPYGFIILEQQKVN